MIEAYVGIPYEDGGRDFLAADCFGVVRLFLHHEATIDLPSYGLVPASDVLRVMRLMSRERSTGTWIAVTKPARFDVVLMSHARRPEICCHIGVMVDEQIMLHSEDIAGAHLASIDEPLVRARISGFYRHSSFAGAMKHAA